jgi:hypothetical protein
MIGFITLYTFKLGTTGSYSAIAILHTFQFTVAQALWFPAFTSRILATDLSQSHCHFKSYMKSSFHRLIPSLPFVLIHLRLPSPELDLILILAAWDPRYIASGRADIKHRFLYCCEACLQRRSIACVVVVAAMCLLSRCLAMGMPVTVFYKETFSFLFDISARITGINRGKRVPNRHSTNEIFLDLHALKAVEK